MPIHRSLLRTAENDASRPTYPSELAIRHLRPRFRLPTPPTRPRHASQGAYPSIATRMAQNSRRAPTFEASLELTHRSWPWLLALLGRLSIKATRWTCRGPKTRALWRLSPPPCPPCLPRLRPACLWRLTCLFAFCCCCISVLNCFSRCAYATATRSTQPIEGPQFFYFLILLLTCCMPHDRK